MKTTGTCCRCSRLLVQGREWASLPRGLREGIRDTHARAFGAGFCEACRKRDRAEREGRTLRSGAVPLDVVVEEWEWLANPWRDDSENIAALAPRLGMTPAALERALYRLRAAGRIAPVREVAA